MTRALDQLALPWDNLASLTDSAAERLLNPTATRLILGQPLRAMVPNLHPRGAASRRLRASM